MNGNIDEIILSILNGNATESEKKLFTAWIQKDEVNQDTFDYIKKHWLSNENDFEIINEDDVKDRIWTRAHKLGKKNSRKIFLVISRVAAVIAFVLAFSFLIKTFLFSPTTEVHNATLKVIEKKNLAGAKSKIHLPDGSIVNLNAESSIKFTEGFKDTVRWVDLSGEAYFNVAKNPEKTFVVKSRDIITKAVGTAFNINAYTENATVEISLAEGKVEIKSTYRSRNDQITYLEPGQSIKYKDNSPLEITSFNVEKVLGWKDGWILFENANYQTVTKKLERWFGVKIELDGIEPEWHLDGKYKDASLERIMEMISDSEKFEYQLLGDTLKIKIK